jgi:alpha-glucosidase
MREMKSGCPTSISLPAACGIPFERLVPGYGLNRDPQRAPMCWDSGENAGFTTGEPWLPISDKNDSRNVAT